MSERLEELQAEDDASGATTFTTTTRGGRQSGSRRRGGLGNQTDGYAISSGAEGSFAHLTPRVRAFVQERLARKADHDEVRSNRRSRGHFFGALTGVSTYPQARDLVAQLWRGAS